MDSFTTPNQAISVTQLNRRARQLLETQFAQVRVRGEISNLARPSSGHWYFSLKDENAQVRCAMFRNRNSLTNFRPRDGQQIVVRGRISLYEARGDYQLLVEHMAVDGVGALQEKFEQLRARLASEGLFAQARKRAVPAYPGHIGVVTSPSGAAIRDILHGLARRLPMVPVSLYPATVQGQNAWREIVAAIELANQHGVCDVLIVGRGGGSLEDLWPFNEEAVARAIAASAIPVISAVGHETDFTIADFVADLRATTPTAAAELAVPDKLDLMARLALTAAKLRRDQRQQLAIFRQKLEWLRKRLRNPGDRLRDKAQHLDQLEIRLRQVASGNLRLQQHRLALTRGRLQSTGLRSRLGNLRDQFEATRDRLVKARQQGLIRDRQRLANLVKLLDTVSPLFTLQRGYSICRDANGETIRSVNDVKPGASLAVVVANGRIDCAVEAVTEGAAMNFLRHRRQR